MMAPQQAAELAGGDLEKRRWILVAPAKDIHLFIHYSVGRNITPVEFELAKTALQMRIAEDADKSVQQLAGQTDRLVVEVGKLVAISNDQKQLATKLEIQTDDLIKLTKAVKTFTVVLVAVGLVQIYLMLKQDSVAHVQNVQPAQHEQPGTTNK